ncbi:MAG: terminase large subunit [Gemmataceae bacterium]|nr:terminase large subunit [Gemmataceae bacterium]
MGSDRRKHPAKCYIDGVLGGGVVAGRRIKLAVERHVRDLERADQNDPAFPYRFDRKAAQRPIDFIQEFCRHSKGEWAGQPVRLEDWQQFCFWVAFGWVEKDTGYRRFRTVYKKVARKNGKSTETSGLGLYLLVGDGEPGAEVYSAATKKDQAKIIHGESVSMVRKSPDLSAELTVVKNNISHVASASKFEPLSSEHETLDGLNVHGGLLDEIHAHPNRGLFDVLETATGSRRQPLIWGITTAGVVTKASIALELEEYGDKILRGIIRDERFLPLMWDIDEGDDPWDERNWRKANPNLGVSCKLDDLRAKAVKARETPAAQNNFFCKHLNVWSNSRSRWVAVERWDACRRDFTLDELAGEECYGGLDLSTTTDVSAFTLVFPRDGGLFLAAAWYWVPEENADLRARRDRVPYPQWIREGHIEATPGNVIDYEFIEHRVVELAKRFRLREIAADPWNATQTLQRLQEKHGLKVAEMRQGFVSMSAPMKHTQALVLSGKLGHLGDPVTRWMWDNVSAKTDPAGNIKPDKEKSAERIDGVVSLIMGVDRAALRKAPVNPYEKRGLLSV